MLEDLLLYELSEENKKVSFDENEEPTDEEKFDYMVKNELFDEGIYDFFTDNPEEFKQFQDYDMFGEN